MYWSLDHSVPGMSKKSNLINKIICCVQEGYSIHRKIFSPNCVKKVKKNPTKFKITNFSLEPLYDWILSKYHQFTCFHTFLCIYDEYLRKKLKIFHFHFFCFLSFFGILAICHIWLPDMRKQLIFWPKWLLAVPLGPTGSQYSKKSKVITLRLCRIHTYDFCLTT